MSLHQSIERQEREFKDLLQRVMQAPLSPITDSVMELKERMDLLEQHVSEIREIELSALSLGADDTRKQIRSLKLLIEEVPREVHDVFQPLLEGLKVQQEQEAALHVAGLKEAIAANQGAIESSQKQGIQCLENFKQTALTRLHSEYESLRSEVGSRLADHAAVGHAGMSQLTQSIAHLQTLLIAQQQELERLQQQHTAYSERQGEQLQNALLPLRKWGIVSVCVAVTSLFGIVALAAGIF